MNAPSLVCTLDLVYLSVPIIFVRADGVRAVAIQFLACKVVASSTWPGLSSVRAVERPMYQPWSEGSHGPLHCPGSPTYAYVPF
eukprot:scaffold309058_cov32-Prasinocladus_malaysianus.AAC.2